MWNRNPKTGIYNLGVRSASIKSLYASWSASCALCFAEIDGGTPIFYHRLLSCHRNIYRNGKRRKEGVVQDDDGYQLKVTVALAGDVRKGENFVARSLSTWQLVRADERRQRAQKRTRWWHNESWRLVWRKVIWQTAEADDKQLHQQWRGAQHEAGWWRTRGNPTASRGRREVWKRGWRVARVEGDNGIKCSNYK